MKISRKRLEAILSQQGFAISLATTNGFSFSRKAKREGLFQKLVVDFQGTHGEAVYGRAGICYTKWIPLEARTVRTLVELATDPERHWAIIETTEQAKAWEQRFAAIAPLIALEYENQHGDELLSLTADARAAATTILRSLAGCESFQSIYDQCYKACTEGVIREAKRLAQWPAVMRLHNCEREYFVSCCMVLGFEDGAKFEGDDPLKNRDLWWRIQLVADGLIAAQRERSEPKLP